MRAQVLTTLLFVLFGYLSGSVLFSEVFMRLFHGESLMDVSENHNPGVSNAYKYGGFLCGTAAVIGDLLKGVLPVALYLKQAGPSSAGLSLVMIAPVLGHAFSCFWKMRGGMSITASFGVFLGLLPNWIPLTALSALFLLALLLPGLDNSIRSVYAYTGLALCSVLLTVGQILPPNVTAGILVIAAIVCWKMWPDLTEEDRSRLKQGIRIR